MKVILASKNQHKLTELSAILSGLGFEIALESEYGLDIDVDETGTTFEENSLLKAEAVMKASGLPVLADDSGLMVDSLDGAPGVYSARYGHKNSDAERIGYLLANLKDVPAGSRTAKFVCVITCLWPDGREDRRPRRMPRRDPLCSAGDRRLRLRPGLLPAGARQDLRRTHPGGKERHLAPRTGPAGLLQNLSGGIGT